MASSNQSESSRSSRMLAPSGNATQPRGRKRPASAARSPTDGGNTLGEPPFDLLGIGATCNDMLLPASGFAPQYPMSSQQLIFDADPAPASEHQPWLPLLESPWDTNRSHEFSLGTEGSYFLEHSPRKRSRLATFDSEVMPSMSVNSTASSISICSTLSPVNTDQQSVYDAVSTAAGASGWSRATSPPHQQSMVGDTVPPVPPFPHVGLQDFCCVVPQCSARFSRNEELQDHIKRAHPHTCNWAGCRMPSFNTKEALSWHVKAEHLLICPVPGCCEADLHSKNLLQSHIRVCHPEAKAKDGLDLRPGGSSAPAPSRTIQPRLENSETGISTPSNDNPDPKSASSYAIAQHARAEQTLKMAMSIATLKKRCREQLKAVMEKRAAKQRLVGTPRNDWGTPKSAGTPRSVGSPQDLVRSRSPRPLETPSFPIVWEHGVLPFLIEFIPKWCGPGHVISVSRGRHQNARRICIMTKGRISRARKVAIAGHVRDLLPLAYRSHATFVFSTGEVQRLWARGLGPQQPDEICSPRNPFCYKDPCMGDSIGTVVEGESTATLGPSLVVGGANFWLANFHPFADVHRHLHDNVTVEHPSPKDRERCVSAGHDALLSGELPSTLGKVVATSGIDLKTARLSNDPWWKEIDLEQRPFVVMDWTLISSNRPQQANMLRRFPTTAPRMHQDVLVTTTSHVVPGATVITTGRTSGHQRGVVCEIPAYLHADDPVNGTGCSTREWYIEEPDPMSDGEAWIKGGIGVEGDSGAAIIDAETNALMGQLWGRNKYWGSGPRFAFFTPIGDIFDDIQEKCGRPARPQLPRYRDEGERFAVYPACMPCYELAAYMNSRRTSHASLRSVVGAAGSSEGEASSSTRKAARDDLTSYADVSELETPKDQSQSYWLRHAGPEDAGLSFVSICSPTNFVARIGEQGLHVGPPVGSPVVAELRSPYATTLDENDLYDDEHVQAQAEMSGKRVADLPLVRTESGGGTKRRKVG